jgi:thiosulfate dehydrogenase [quinone] large subunit
MSSTMKALTFYFRMTMAWTFLYAASHQTFHPEWSAGKFLATTKTFHSFFATFAQPAILPYTDVLVSWGHLLIGLSLLAGALTRVSAAFGILLILYYFAHMDFPYIENTSNFLVDYHLVYAGVLAYLIAMRAAHVMGLDRWLERQSFVATRPAVLALVK